MCARVPKVSPGDGVRAEWRAEVEAARDRHQMVVVQLTFTGWQSPQETSGIFAAKLKMETELTK